MVLGQMTLWFFVWGVLVVTLKFSRAPHPEWLAPGVFGVDLLACLVGLRERCCRPAFEKSAPVTPTSMPAAAKAKTAAPVAAVAVAPEPAPEKMASTESAIDALRKARERAQRRTDQEP